MRIYLPKIHIHGGHKAELNVTLRVDKILYLPKSKSITVLLYDFLTGKENSLLSLL